MSVRYITVTPITNLFVPATQSFGDIAIVGAVNTNALGPKKTPVAITNPLAVASQAVTLVTGGATAAGAATMQFAAVPPTIQPGMVVADLTNGSVIPSTQAQPVALATNGATAGANTTLQFAAVPSTIQKGMVIVDLTNPALIPAGTTVASTTSTTVVMSQGAAGAGVGNGDVIQFFAGTAVVSMTNTTVVMSQNATGVGVASGDAIQFTSPFNGKPVDDIGWFNGALS